MLKACIFSRPTPPAVPDDRRIQRALSCTQRNPGAGRHRGSPSPTPVPTLAYTKIRTGSAFSVPGPGDHAARRPPPPRRARKPPPAPDVFDIVRGPGALNEQNEFDASGVRTVGASTQVPDGDRDRASIAGGACVGAGTATGRNSCTTCTGAPLNAGADLWRTNETRGGGPRSAHELIRAAAGGGIRVVEIPSTT